MWYRQPERLSEECGYREPIGEPSDESRLGCCPNKQNQEARLRRQPRPDEHHRHPCEHRRRDQAISTEATALKILRA